MKTTAIPIYGGKLIVCRNQAEFDRSYNLQLAGAGLQRCDDTGSMCSLGGMTAHTVVGGKLVIVSGVFDRKGSTRCHEAVHCAQAVAEAVCLDPLREVEAFAYLVQWFYEELAP